jgi:hypothetical protein
MPTKSLKRRGVIALGALVATSVARIGPVQAELVLNFPLKGDSKLSREASATLLYGASQIFAGIQQAELDRDKATDKLKEGVAYLAKARSMFSAVQKYAGTAPLNPEKVKLLREAVIRIQNVHGLKVIPKSMDELSQLAISEVDRFMEATKGMSFESVQKARATTLTFSTAIHRLLDVGVLVSELAETADIK